jgi:hypothetical protein
MHEPTQSAIYLIQQEKISISEKLKNFKTIVNKLEEKELNLLIFEKKTIDSRLEKLIEEQKKKQIIIDNIKTKIKGHKETIRQLENDLGVKEFIQQCLNNSLKIKIDLSQTDNQLSEDSNHINGSNTESPTTTLKTANFNISQIQQGSQNSTINYLELPTPPPSCNDFNNNQTNIFNPNIRIHLKTNLTKRLNNNNRIFDSPTPQRKFHFKTDKGSLTPTSYSKSNLSKDQQIEYPATAEFIMISDTNDNQAHEYTSQKLLIDENNNTQKNENL